MPNILLMMLFIMSCIFIEEETKDVPEPVKIQEQKPGCKYDYFLNNEQKLDSVIIECSDPKPPGSLDVNK